jgi:hypothetical protein
MFLKFLSLHSQFIPHSAEQVRVSLHSQFIGVKVYGIIKLKTSLLKILIFSTEQPICLLTARAGWHSTPFLANLLFDWLFVSI